MATTAMSLSPLPAPTAQSPDEHRPDLPRPYKCPLCDKAFHRLEHQTRHIRTHTGEKPHACMFPSCNKRFSRSDELTRHSRIHNNPNSRRGNKQHASATAAAVVAQNGGLYDTSPLHPITQHTPLHQTSPYHPVSNGQFSPQHMNMSSPPPMVQPTSPTHHMLPAPMMMPPPPKNIRSAPVSQLSSPNVSPPHSYSTYTSAPGAYMTRNLNGDISPAANANYHRAMDINMLASAASEIERENTSSIPSHHLSLPSRSSFSAAYHNHPYGSGRMASLSSYHYSSNPSSQPMSRSHSHEEEDHRPHKKSRPGSPQSTAPPSPEFPHESTSPTPDHTPLATPSHSPRLRPMYHYHSGVQLPTLHQLSLHNQPPPALAPVEPSTDGTQPYVPVHHSGLRISEIMEAGDGAQRKLPVPMVSGGGFSVRELADVRHSVGGVISGHSSARASEAGNDLHDRY